VVYDIYIQNFLTNNIGEKILKIGPHLAKLLSNIKWLTFLIHSVDHHRRRRHQKTCSLSMTDRRNTSDARLQYCVTPRCRLSSGQSPSAHPVPGLDSPKRLTGSESMDSYDAASAVATGYCSPDTPTFAEQCATVDEHYYLITFVITRITYCSLLPPPSTASQNYHLRPRAHSQQLPQHTGHLTDSNFITRVLFTDIY